jgi:hypothetical protein
MLQRRVDLVSTVWTIGRRFPRRKRNTNMTKPESLQAEAFRSQTNSGIAYSSNFHFNKWSRFVATKSPARNR